jgi:hypothetical protein
MISRSALALAMVGLFASPALAFHCPADAKAIDAAMSKVQLDDSTRAQVQTLRDEGMALHEAGNHREAVDKMSEAMRLLLNSL